MFGFKIIYVVKPPFIQHEMLLLPSGDVIHNAPIKNIKIESLEIARGGREVHYKETVWLDLSEYELRMRAQQLSQRKRYNIVSYNCQRFLEDLTGQKTKNNQLHIAAILGALAFGTIAYMRNA